METQFSRAIILETLDYYLVRIDEFLDSVSAENVLRKRHYPKAVVLRLEHEKNLIKNLVQVINRAQVIDLSGDWAPEFKRIIKTSLNLYAVSLRSADKEFEDVFKMSLYTVDVAHLGISDQLMILDELIKKLS